MELWLNKLYQLELPFFSLVCVWEEGTSEISQRPQGSRATEAGH